jgi:tetratricopeptide (TPR) repeat protein
MVSRISASEEGLKIINLARERKGWAKAEETWFQSALTSKSTLKRFWLKKRIDQEVFVAICEQVGVKDWQAIVAQPPPTAPMPPNPRAYKTDTWVGRSTIIDELLPKLQDKTRLVWITGISGIGKTTLGECLASRAWESNPTFRWDHLEVSEGQGADFTTIAADLLAKLGDRELDPQERNDPKRLTDRLVRKLQSSCYWVQLDSLERLLNPEQGTEFADDHWVIFLRRCLTERDFGSRLVLTAQALPSVLVEFADRYPNVWAAKTLAGLSANELQNEHLEFFGKHGVVVDEANQAVLSKLGQVYEGHTLVLQVMSGEIQADFAGDAGRYWVVNQQEFEQVARSLDAKRLDETEYNDELDRRVRDRVKQSLQQLPTDARDLLLRSSVYRRPVPKKFWLGLIDDRSVSHQKEAYRVLSDRAFVEREGIYQKLFLIRQHNLVRAVASDLLKVDTQRWHTAERQAAHFWLTTYAPVTDALNLEAVRGYLEAVNHYCEVGDGDAVRELFTNPIDTPAKSTLSRQLDTWSYYQEEIHLGQKLLGKYGPATDIKCWNDIGNGYFGLGDYPKATEAYENCLRIAREIGDCRGEGHALGGLGNVYTRLGQYEQAINCYQQYLTIAREIGDHWGESASLGSLGVAYKNLGQYERAIACHQQCLTIAREIGNRRSEGYALGNLGLAYKNLGQYEQAVDYHQQQLTIAREIGDRWGESNALSSLGLAHNRLGQYERAIDCHQQCLTIAREIGNRWSESNALGNLGSPHVCLGQNEQAIDCYQQCLTIAREIGHRRAESASLGNLGITYEKLGEYAKAVDYAEQHLASARKIGDRQGEGSGFRELGVALLRQQNITEALENLQFALRIFQEVKSRDDESQALKNLAELHQVLGEIELARQYCQQALELATELGIPLADECRTLQEEIENNTSVSSG